MHIIIIAAVAENNVIGKDNKIPWHYKEDFQHFKALTSGHIVVMGRKTYESIGKPLPNRTNIVVSRNKELQILGCAVAESLTKAIHTAKKNNAQKCFIIGGSSLYAEALLIADQLELTHVHKVVDGDTYFPTWNKDEWKETERQDFQEFSFVTYTRKEEGKNE